MESRIKTLLDQIGSVWDEGIQLNKKIILVSKSTEGGVMEELRKINERLVGLKHEYFSLVKEAEKTDYGQTRKFLDRLKRDLNKKRQAEKNQKELYRKLSNTWPN